MYLRASPEDRDHFSFFTSNPSIAGCVILVLIHDRLCVRWPHSTGDYHEHLGKFESACLTKFMHSVASQMNMS